MKRFLVHVTYNAAVGKECEVEAARFSASFGPDTVMFVTDRKRIRVSFIEYLNSVPLGWSFLKGPQRDIFDLSLAVPSECADQLARGDADVGLIPAIEYQRIPDLRIIPDISISSRREVRTVLFASKAPLHEIRSIALDSSSRTSIVLLRIILESFLGLSDIEYHPHEPDPERMLNRFDGALIIGNPAFRVPRDRFLLHDLAREWYRFTGLPFVFALWAVRSGVDLGDKADLFLISKEAGIRSVSTIAEAYSQELNLPRKLIRDYLLDSLDYSLDETNIRGLQTFFEEARKLEAISEIRAIEFYELVQKAP